MIAPTFRFEMLNSFYETMEEQARVLVTNLGKQAAKGKPFELTKLLQNCTLDIICATAMRVTFGAQDDSNSDHEHDQCLRKLHDFTERVRTTWCRSRGAFSILTGFSDDP